VVTTADGALHLGHQVDAGGHGQVGGHGVGVDNG
jgi:hypothetical protein